MDLIKIDNKEENSAVNGRELHNFLESRQEFSKWIHSRIKDYDFKEGVDYVKVSTGFSIGRRKKEFSLSIAMAKELAMLEGNEKGKQARKYFIKVEEEFKKQHTIKPLSQLELMQESIKALIEQDKRISEQGKKIEEQDKRLISIEEKANKQEKELKPKADYYDKILDSTGLLTTGNVASEFGIKAQGLNQYLQAKGVQYKEGKSWVLKKIYLDKGLGRQITETFTNKKTGKDFSENRLKWTQKGKEFIINLKRNGIDPYNEKNNLAHQIKKIQGVNINVEVNVNTSQFGEAECKNCGTVFTKKVHNQKYCKSMCRLEFNDK